MPVNTLPDHSAHVETSPSHEKGTAQWIYTPGVSRWAISVQNTTPPHILAGRRSTLQAEYSPIGRFPDPGSLSVCYAYTTDMPFMRWAMGPNADKNFELQLQRASSTGVPVWQGEDGFVAPYEFVTNNEQEFVAQVLEREMVTLNEKAQMSGLLTAEQSTFCSEKKLPPMRAFLAAWQAGVAQEEMKSQLMSRSEHRRPDHLPGSAGLWAQSQQQRPDEQPTFFAFNTAATGSEGMYAPIISHEGSMSEQDGHAQWQRYGQMGMMPHTSEYGLPTQTGYTATEGYGHPASTGPGRPSGTVVPAPYGTSLHTGGQYLEIRSTDGPAHQTGPDHLAATCKGRLRRHRSLGHWTAI